MVLRASHVPTSFGDIEKALGFSVGYDSMFDRLFGELSTTSSQHGQQGYPPYNIRKEGDSKYFIELAVAGLSEDDLEVELKESVLEIRSKQTKEDESKYVHRGIATRTFMRTFTLADDMVVKGCQLVNGMLTVELEKVIPEDKRARLIPINKDGKKIKQVN